MSRKRPRAQKDRKAPSADASTPASGPRRILARFRIVAALLLTGGLVGLCHTGGEWWSERRLRDQGIAVPAEVISYDRTITARGQTTYQVTVQYKPVKSWAESPDGLRKQFPLPEQSYKEIRAGGPLTVRYMPEDPEGAMLDGQASDLWVKVVLSLGALALGGILAFFAFRKPRPIPRE
jgi:hypothetical protein